MAKRKPKPKTGRKPKRYYPSAPHNAGNYEFSFRLTVPPSVNSIWSRGAHGQFLSPTYRKWRQTNVVKIDAEESLRLTKDVCIHIYITPGKGFRSNSDIDNRVKGILDLLVWAGVIEDDSAKHVIYVGVGIHTEVPFNSKHPATATVNVIGSSDGFQKLPPTSEEGSESRIPKGNSKVKSRSKTG